MVCRAAGGRAVAQPISEESSAAFMKEGWRYSRRIEMRRVAFVEGSRRVGHVLGRMGRGRGM